MQHGPHCICEQATSYFETFVLACTELCASRIYNLVNYDKPPRNSEKVSTFHNDCDGIIVYDRGDNYIQC